MDKKIKPKQFKGDSIKVVARAKQPKTIDPTHSQLCKAIVDYMRSKHPDKLFIKITNEGNLEQMGKLKAEGLLPGAFDYLLCHVRTKLTLDNTYIYDPGLFIEVKTKKDRLSKAQKEFRQRALDAHYAVMVVNNIDDFMKEIDEYCRLQLVTL